MHIEANPISIPSPSEDEGFTTCQSFQASAWLKTQQKYLKLFDIVWTPYFKQMLCCVKDEPKLRSATLNGSVGESTTLVN